MVTTLRAAEKFEKSHLTSTAVAPFIDEARIFYVEGYFLTHGKESVLELSKKASEKEKVPCSEKNSLSWSLYRPFLQIFVLNLSAPFIVQFFNNELRSILPFVDYIIGNEAEAEAWAIANDLPDTKDLRATAKDLVAQLKSNSTRESGVIFTQGADPTIAVSSNRPDYVKEYTVNALKHEDIVDTNGAGDAFAGGFIGALAVGKELDEAIKVGHTLGAMCVTQVGPQYKWPKVNVLN